MNRLYFGVALLMALLSSCTNISNATVADIEKACKKEDWITAKKMCEAFVKKDKSNPVVFKYLGDAYLGLKDSSFAQYSYDLALSLDSSYIDAMVCSADVLMNGGSAPLAIKRLQKQMEAYPDNAKLHNAIGCAFRLSGNNNEAQANFEQAIHLDPDYATPRKNLAIIQIGNSELEDAILNLEIVLDKDPKQADACNYLGLAYAFSEKADEAEKMFLKSISIDEKYLPALENLAYHYDHNNKLDKAKIYYMKAAALGSENATETLKNSKFNKNK